MRQQGVQDIRRGVGYRCRKGALGVAQVARKPGTNLRSAVVARVRRALKDGGRFVAEFGGKGNVATIIAAVRAEAPGAANPWYYPSLGEYASLLEAHGFRVTQAFHFDRPTALEGERGMRDWLDMFGTALLAGVPAAERNAVCARIVERLRPTLFRDGTWFADYVRLRILACI